MVVIVLDAYNLSKMLESMKMFTKNCTPSHI